MTGEEFRELRDSKGFTQKKAASLLGISVRQIGNIEKGTTPVKDIYVEKISTYGKPDVRDGWVMQHSTIVIPALEIKASAGDGNNLESIDAFESYAKINVDKMLFKTAPTKNMRAIQVDGYSMAPMLMPDSWVIFELDRGYDGDGLYIINWRNVLMVKKVQLDMGTGKFNIISANPDYDSYSVDPDDQSVFRIVGKVIRAII